MKFAKELEREAVPEWRIKYLDYKAGKKYVKAICRAINRTTSTPRPFNNHRTPTFLNVHNPRRSTSYDRIRGEDDGDPADSKWPREPPPASRGAENDTLTGHGESLHYGSFVPTPMSASLTSHDVNQVDFTLPSPAIYPEPESHANPAGASRDSTGSANSAGHNRSKSAANVSKLRTLTKQSTSSPANLDTPSPFRRILSHAPGVGGLDSSRNGPQTFDLVHEREHEFFEFLDSELDKVESFYKMKEQQSAKRLSMLREQLHEMRNRRIQEMSHENGPNERSSTNEDTDNSQENKSYGWVHPFKARMFPPGPNSKALRSMVKTPHLHPNDMGNNRDGRTDFIRRPDETEVSYRTAKKKLKLAMQEFYRSLELLKAYAVLNRTAFRKLNKKFDKAVNARPPLRYLNEKVNKSWFVNSDLLESHIKAVEDLYARYFERGNQKLAACKLRGLTKKPKDESGSSFFSGFLIGTGLLFTIEGLVFGAELLFDDDPKLRRQTSYLMQIYAGYFLMLALFSMFCINCYVWTKTKVNYSFIFEFDPRSHIDWRQLSQFPSFCLLILGVVMWANFSRYGAEEMYLYYPVVLIILTALFIFMPAPWLAHKSRRWFAYSHWRLLLAGVYPVEFRDFFLGDMYCSLTYAMANVELFFCLYANKWDNPNQCNSGHSRLLGFMTTLPAIWRSLQCIRRYKDTRNIFPHLVNCGKYGMTIAANVCLSLYRIHDSRFNLALFIAFSVVNSVYCSIWDLFMDFSLLQTQARHRGLRDILALKSRWVYYTIMVVDPFLRFSWILYAIFTHNTQHSTVVSFVVALMEIFRRGIWALLRVENEHCANVAQYKASRDVPLPYRIEPLMDRASAETSPVLHPVDHKQPQISHQNQQRHDGTFPHSSSSTAVPSSFGVIRRRTESVAVTSGMQPVGRTFSRILAEAHKQDFEKKRKPLDAATESTVRDDASDDDDEDEAGSFMEIRSGPHGLRTRKSGDEEV